MYYVPKKNRCKISCPVSGSTQPSRHELLFKSTLSSINAYNTGAKNVYSAFRSQHSNGLALYANKGTGNLQKRGSGGNSYAAYLARIKGDLLCCCCQEIDIGVTSPVPSVGDKAVGGES